MADKIVTFIDGPNLYNTCTNLGLNLDYKLLRLKLQKMGNLVRIKYYTALRNENEFSSLRKLTDYLQYNGYDLVTKEAKTYTDNITGREKVKGNCDVELAVDMIKHAEVVDHLVLFTGDGDFIAAVHEAQERGAKVTVVSTIKTTPWMVSDDLRRKADDYIDLSDWRNEIAKQESQAADFSLRKQA